MKPLASIGRRRPVAFLVSGNRQLGTHITADLQAIELEISVGPGHRVAYRFEDREQLRSFLEELQGAADSVGWLR